MSTCTPLQAPFPWFGGKRTIAPAVWERFGEIKNYVEPFFGSGAVLLQRPMTFKSIETVNDKDRYLSNFWRAVRSDPEQVAFYADCPVNEADLEAKHYWLVTTGAQSLVQGLVDPDWFDPKVAGWWVWGICSWIGSEWCAGTGPWAVGDQGFYNYKKLCPEVAGQGIKRQLPHLGNAGQGINRKRPQEITRKDFILSWMLRLSERLRDTRVCCGDWTRVCGPSVTIKQGLTGVFLDPPYGLKATRSKVYNEDDFSIADSVKQWAVENGNNPLMRIALCGYDTEHDMPSDWTTLPWKAVGGYGSQGQGRGRENAARETLWFSPHCLKIATLFERG